MKKMTLDELEKYYLKIIKEEEERIRKLTRQAFSRKRHIHSHPSMILGVKIEQYSDVKVERVKQLRQRAIELSKITKEDIYRETSNYLFDNNFFIMDEWIRDHFKVPNNRFWLEIKRIVATMNDEEKRLFVELGYAIPLRQEYEAMQEDIRNDNDYLFFEHFRERLLETKEQYRKQKEKYL